MNTPELRNPNAINLDSLRRYSVDEEDGEFIDRAHGRVVSHDDRLRERAFSLDSNNEEAPRLLDRKGPFQQSMGRMNIRRVTQCRSTIQKLRRHDRFHTLIAMSTVKIIAIAVAVIIGSWLVVAILFRFIITWQCDLQADSFLRSLYLAIQTIETIGYGIKDPFFHDCYSGLFVLGASALWGSLLNALLISVVYTRVSRAQSRAASVCFSEKAIISQIDGNWYFMFQICDFRKHQLCEAHLRLYCIQHAEASGGIRFQTRAMRVQHPDDELNGMLLLALPQLVIHRIDPWSPLCPQTNRRCNSGTPANSFNFPDIPQRAADGENGNRDPGNAQPATPNLSQVVKHLQQGKFEILCLAEGIDPSTSNTLQHRHSYAYDQIVFNASFNRCVSRGDDGTCEINFDAFHEIVHIDELSEMLVQSMP